MNEGITSATGTKGRLRTPLCNATRSFLSVCFFLFGWLVVPVKGMAQPASQALVRLAEVQEISEHKASLKTGWNSGPAVAPASSATETIRVTGDGLSPLSQRYQRLERIFRRFDSFPEVDRHGLTLHMQAVLQPGDRSAHASGLMMRHGGEIIHLITGGAPGRDDEINLPHENTFWEADPVLYARLKPGEHLSINFFFTVASPDKQYFTRQQAQFWLRQLDLCIRDEGGFLLALLLPDTHRLGVDVAPGSRFEVEQHGVTHLLVDNRGDQSYHYVFRPEDFGRDAQFRASKPLLRIVMTLPFALHGQLTPE